MRTVDYERVVELLQDEVFEAKFVELLTRDGALDLAEHMGISSVKKELEKESWVQGAGVPKFWVPASIIFLALAVSQKTVPSTDFKNIFLTDDFETYLQKNIKYILTIHKKIMDRNDPNRAVAMRELEKLKVKP
jgi:hypothetical protein